jgi:hypothetical protein
VNSKFEVRRFEFEGESITDLTVQVGVGSPDRLPEGVWEKVVDGVEALLNAPGHRLPNGDLLHVTVEQVVSDPHPNGLNVQLVGRDEQMTRSAWWADADPIDYAHEITHMLGLRDESRHAVAPHRPDIAGSLLGDYRSPAPAGLAQGGLRGRHLQLIAAHIGEPGPVGSVPPPPTRPSTVGGHPGAEPYAPVPPTSGGTVPGTGGTVPGTTETTETTETMVTDPEHTTPPDSTRADSTGPGSTGPGATPASVDPTVQGVVDLAVADLAARLSISPADITVVTARPTTWPDSSIGCPKPGMQYLQVLVDGALVELFAGGQTYSYHSGDDGRPSLCERNFSGQAIPPSTTR